MAIDLDQVDGLSLALQNMNTLLGEKFGINQLPTIAQVQGLTAALAGAAIMSRGTYVGGVISNAPGFTTSRLAISPFMGRDTTNAVDIVLPTGITKSISAQWSAGDAGGSRDSATPYPATSWLHVFAIRRDSDGLTDILTSQSASNPTLPWPGKFRRLRGWLTDASGNLYQMKQKPNGFLKKIPRGTEVISNNGQNQTTTGVLRQLHVPRGIKILPLLLFGSAGSDVAGNAYWSLLHDPDDGAVPTFGVPTQEGQIRAVGGAGLRYLTHYVDSVWTDTNGQIITASSDPNDTIALGTVGYWDPAHLEYGAFA